MQGAREAIAAGTFADYRAQVTQDWTSKGDLTAG
jgi:hypothetical protein